MKDEEYKQPVEGNQEWPEVKKRLQFEQLLSQISSTYINLPGDQIDKVIRRDLGRLGRFLGADWCNFRLFHEDSRPEKFDWRFAWWAEEISELTSGVLEWINQDPAFFDNFQYHFECFFKGKVERFSHLEELPEEEELIKEALSRLGVKSVLSVPVSVSGKVVGGLLVSTIHSHRTWSDELIPRLRLVGEVFANSLARKRWGDSLQKALAEIKELKAKIEADYQFLREEANLGLDFRGIIGRSEAFENILKQVKQVSPTNATVLFLGETGTGKGFMARALHNASKRRDRPFMQINCASLAPSLIESEFFGHEKGAFTGAQSRRIGWFEKAKGTTLFLDEIGELFPELQTKLLRVLQDGEFERVGGSDTVRTDVRIVAATNRNLEKDVEEGRFREDLWYRLTVFPIFIPPLRARVDDIPLFVNAFVNRHSKTIGKRFDAIPQKTLKMLQQYSWPGNIRELENLIERAVITSPANHLNIQLPLPLGRQKARVKKTLKEHERDYIIETLEETYWRIGGPLGAAARLGLNPSTLRSRMRKLDIRRPISRTIIYDSHKTLPN